MEVFVFVTGRTAGQAIAERVDDVYQVASAGVVTDSLDDQSPRFSIAERAQPSVDGLVVAMAQIGELEVDGCLIQLGQNFVRPTHWQTPHKPSPHSVGPDHTVKAGPCQVDNARRSRSSWRH